MIFQEMLREEYEDGKAEGWSLGQVSEKIESILELLKERGTVDQELEQSIRTYTELDKLKKLFSLAIRAESVEQFKVTMKEI